MYQKILTDEEIKRIQELQQQLLVVYNHEEILKKEIRALIYKLEH